MPNGASPPTKEKAARDISLASKPLTASSLLKAEQLPSQYNKIFGTLQDPTLNPRPASADGEQPKAFYHPPENYYIQLDIQFATAYGVNVALLTDKIHRLQDKLQGQVDDQGNKWVRMTAKEWQNELPFWSERTIWQVIKDAGDIGILLTRTFSGRSKWYRLNPEFVTTRNICESQLATSASPTRNPCELPKVHVQESKSNKEREKERVGKFDFSSPAITFLENQLIELSEDHKLRLLAIEERCNGKTLDFVRAGLRRSGDPNRLIPYVEKCAENEHAISEPPPDKTPQPPILEPEAEPEPGEPPGWPDWPAILQDLRGQMTRATFDTNLRDTVAILDKSNLVIKCHSSQAVEWLQYRLRAIIEQTVSRFTDQELTITFEANQ